MTRREFIAASLCTLATPYLATAQADSARERWIDMLGDFPDAIPSLDAKVTEHDSLEDIKRFHVSFKSEEDDRVTAWLLIPKTDGMPGPAVICPHSTTQGAGKDRIIGLCGATHSDPPDEPANSRAYALELARWGYVTLAIDLACDGERVPEGLKPYNSNAFYEKHPEWSMVGKAIWDVMRSVDFLLTRAEVDPDRIACLGHSLGGHTSLFAGAFDPRIAAVVSNGGQLSWVRDKNHWSRPPDPRGRPVSSYIYIPRFRPYIEDPNLPIPIDFTDLMAMVAPRPLLIMCSEDEGERDGLVHALGDAYSVYSSAGAGDRLTWFTYPGGHNYPPVAKRLSFSWLDRWLDHTPKIETIWPGHAI